MNLAPPPPSRRTLKSATPETTEQLALRLLSEHAEVLEGIAPRSPSDLMPRSLTAG
jgi:hypothetical protein